MKCKICKSNSTLYRKGYFDDRYGYPGKFNIFICKACGFGQLDPQLKDSELSDLYTNYYPRQGITSKSIISKVEYKNGIISSIGRWFSGTNNVCHNYVTPGKKALDIGCGNAVSLLEMKKRNIDAYGIEEDRNLEKPAKELGLKVEIGNIYNSKLPNNYFDYITISQVLEHIPNPEKFLIAARKKTKKNGQLIASFPNFDSVYRKLCGKKWIHWHVPFHLNHFSKKSLEILAKNTGFKITKYKVITPTTWSILQIENILLNSKEGEIQEQWNSKENNKQSFIKILIRKILYCGMLILRLIFSIINKFVDLIDKGDGVIIFMEKI